MSDTEYHTAPETLSHDAQEPSRRVIIVTLEQQGITPGVLTPTRTAHPGAPPVILDNGTFPKTRPCDRKRARNRWKRKARSG